MKHFPQEYDDVPFELFAADQMVQWLGQPAAVPEVPGSNPG